MVTSGSLSREHSRWRWLPSLLAGGAREGRQGERTCPASRIVVSGVSHCRLWTYTGQVSAGDFGERARQEAERYGTDPWVFVRELLQNARDAGAGRVILTAERREGRDVVTCRDDGCGMSLEHARRFLFTLYASSKGRRSGAAGRFGVGFWSVLRFDPDTITVRSRPADGDGWEVVLDAGLGALEPAGCVMFEGTEVILERAARGNHPLPMVLDAALRDARYLRPPGDEGSPLEVSVNGRRITEELNLPAPSLSFRRPGLRGAVALGGEARVDVLAHGLRVRSAPFLDELLMGGEASPASVELAEGLLPRVVLDSDRLEVLLARGDVGDSPTLRRAVASGHRALRRLVRSELDRSAPLSGPRRWLEQALEMRPASRVVAMLGAAFGGALLGVGLAVLVVARSTPGVDPARDATMPAPDSRSVAGFDHPFLYRDLAASYGGPSVDVFDDRRELALSYRPAAVSPWLAALRLNGERDGRGSDEVLVGPYEGAPCHESCLDVEVEIDAAPGSLRLPVATGHVLDPDSVRLDGGPQELQVSVTGEPVLVLGARHRGVVHYRTGPAPVPAVSVATSWPPLPAGLAADAARLRRLPPAARVEAATRLVASRIRYDRSQDVAESHRRAISGGAGALERALVIGAGDCDVQNFVLAALLDATGLPSRLAVGFVGRGGRAVGGLHAWVEVLHHGRWWVADASLAAAGASSQGAPAPRVLSAASERRSSGAIEPPAIMARPATAWVVVGLAVAATLLVWVVAAWWRLARVHGPDVACSGEGDLTPLLRAALLRPQAWRGVEAMYGRPLVPLLNRRGPISLRRALALARSGRLYRATAVSDLVRRASAGSAAVVDAGRPEGLVVAELLGALDLDPWRGVLERASQEEVTKRVEEALRRAGLRVRLCVVPEAPVSVAVIDGAPFGYGRGSSLVAVDPGSRLWTVVSAAALERPEWAALLLGDEIVECWSASRVRETRLRSELALRALRGVEA